MVLNKFNLAYWGCKLWLPFSGNAADLSGSGNTGTVTGATLIKVKNGGTCYSFDGSGDYISIADSDDWYFDTGNFTICMWVTFSTLGAYSTLIAQYVDDSNYWQWRKNDTNTLQFLWTDGGTSRGNFTIPSFATASVLYHVAIVRSGYTCSIYVNGNSQTVTTTTAWGTLGNLSAPLRIGDNGAGSNGHTGKIKDVMIFKGTALTEAQIKALYNATYIS